MQSKITFVFYNLLYSKDNTPPFFLIDNNNYNIYLIIKLNQILGLDLSAEITRLLKIFNSSSLILFNKLLDFNSV